MTDEKDFSNPGGVNMPQDDDIIDAEVVSGSSASYQDAEEYGAGDSGGDFGDDDAAPFLDDDDRGGGDEPRDMKKFMLPGLILAAAVGVGAFMVMGSGNDNAAPSAVVAENPPTEWEQQADAVPADLSSDSPDSFLPQPAVNVNQADGGTVAGDPAAAPASPESAQQDPFASPDPNALTAGDLPIPDAPDGMVVADGQLPSVDSAMADIGAPPVAEAAGAEPVDPVPADSTVAADSEAVPPADPVGLPDQVAQAETQVPADPNSPGYTTDTSTIYEMPPDAQAVQPPAMPSPGVMPPPAVAVPPSPGNVTGATPSSDVFPGAPGQVPAPASTVTSAAGDAAAPVEPSQTVPQVDRYYDSLTNVPDNALATAMGPRKVDPVLEPASKFVVVEKTHAASDSEAQLVSANRALKLGRYDAAVEMFESLYKINPRDPRILMGRAVAYQHIGRPESAIHSYEELLDVDSNNADALVNMLGLLREQYPEVALRRLINLHEKYPGNAGIAAQIGVTQGGLGQTDDALRYLNIASSIEPRNAQHIFNTAVVLDRAGRREDAIRYYQQALEADAVYGGSRSVPRTQIYDRLSILRQQH